MLATKEIILEKELPQGWYNAKLGETISIIRGISFPKDAKRSNFEKGLIACLRTTQTIGDNAGFSKKLFMHLARHTFATTITLSNGVPMETVSKMLGHSETKTTQIYAKVVAGKIKIDMDIILNEPAPVQLQN